MGIFTFINKRGSSMNNTIKTIMNRGSLRGYKNETIKDEHLDLILKSAMRAPTAGNMMMYSILVVKDHEKKKKLSKSCDNQPFIANASVLLVFLADLSKWYKYYEQNQAKAFLNENGEKFQGPTESEFILAMQDAVIAAENAVIAAESLNIGSCYIGDIMEQKEYHKELFNLPNYVYPVTMVALGYYPDNYKVPLKERFEEKYVVFNEEYKNLSSEEISDMYKKWDEKFNVKNKYNAENFAQYHFKMKTKSDFAKEMRRSVKLALNEFSGEEK